jgi:hypothetical protein
MYSTARPSSWKKDGIIKTIMVMVTAMETAMAVGNITEP